MSVSIIAASNNHNLKLAQEFEKAFDDLKIENKMLNLVDLDLPLYTPEKENNVPSEIANIVKQFKENDAFVFIAPEYNGGIPPVLTNLISWVSISTKNWRKAFNGKFAIIATHSGGGGAHVLSAMRIQLSFIGITVLGREILTNLKKPLNPDSLKAVTEQIAGLIKN